MLVIVMEASDPHHWCLGPHEPNLLSRNLVTSVVLRALVEAIEEVSFFLVLLRLGVKNHQFECRNHHRR